MAQSCVRLLEKFGTCSTIMLYFGHADRSFLILSQFSRKSRMMLDNNYDAFLNCIIDSIVCLKIENDCQRKLLFLPCDLFKFSIEINDNCLSLITTFIQLIKNIRDLRGHYFNNHFMHKRLSLNKLVVSEELIYNFNQIHEFMKTTMILRKEDNLISLKPLIEIIAINCKPTINYAKNKVFNSILNRKRIIEPVFKSSKRIHNFDNRDQNNKSLVKPRIFSAIQDLNIEIDKYTLEPVDLNQCNIFLNPEVFMKRVDCIEFYLNSNNFSFLAGRLCDNIVVIQPKKIKIINKTIGKIDDLILIKMLKSCQNLSRFNCDHSSRHNINLCFTNVPILIKSFDQDPIVIKLDRFLLDVHSDNINSSFWFSKETSNDCFKESTFLHLVGSQTYQFDNPTILRADNSNQFTEEFSTFLPICNHKCEFIVPMRCLNSVDVNQYHMAQFIINSRRDIMINEIYNTPNFSCTLKYKDFIENYDEYFSVFPSKCNYSFIHEIDDEISVSDIDCIAHLFKNIYISNIKFDFIKYSDVLQLMNKAVSFTNIKLSLRKVDMFFYTFEQAIDFLELLSNCPNLSSVVIRYNIPSIFNTSESKIIEKAIRDAKNEFYKKCGIINELLFYQSDTERIKLPNF